MPIKDAVMLFPVIVPEETILNVGAMITIAISISPAILARLPVLLIVIAQPG
jgi:hypothetical protein